MSGHSGLASRLYRGEAGLNIVGRRKLWFTVAAAIVLVAVLSFAVRGFTLGIEFAGGSQWQLPTSVGTLTQAEDAVDEALGQVDNDGEPLEVASAQEVGGGEGSYLIRTSELTAEQSEQVKQHLVEELGVPAGEISSERVSGAWGAQVTERALLGLGIFIVLVMLYLIIRFEWRMAIASVSALALDLITTAGVYSLVGFEVTPSTIVGFLTILGFALYDVVVVFDKIQENTRGITASGAQTYAEGANLAVNQTLMRSINTSVVSLLPVGGLLFIGAGLLGAGTLRDLGLVLFVGMAVAFYSSIFFATPLLVSLKELEPRYKAHTQRVLARRAAIARGEVAPKSSRPTKQAVKQGAGSGGEPGADAELAGVTGATPKTGARPSGTKRSGGGRGGRPGGNRPGRKRR